MKTSSRPASRITGIMKGDEPGQTTLLGWFLTGLSRVYGGAAKLRERFYQTRVLQPRKLPCTVISIGNLTLGGTGKTPMTLYMARLLVRMGYRIVIISRGYKGKAEKKGGIVSDGRRILMGPDEAGDEPFMMAASLKTIPIVVGQDRYLSGMSAIGRFAPHIVLLDDAFQHYQLFRDLDVVLLDARRPFGNHHLVPRGILREPPSALVRADAFVFTRSDLSDMAVLSTARRHLPTRPVFNSVHRPVLYRCTDADKPNTESPGPPELIPVNPHWLEDRSVYAFSGIADNDDFRRIVSGACRRVTGFRGFADHHPYSGTDVAALLTAAKASGAETIITTEKDHARIGHKIHWAGTRAVFGIEVDFGAGSGAFDSFVRQRLEMINTGG